MRFDNILPRRSQLKLNIFLSVIFVYLKIQLRLANIAIIIDLFEEIQIPWDKRS